MVGVRCRIFTKYIGAALERTEYKVIEDDGPYFAEVLVLDGVWAIGKAIEEYAAKSLSPWSRAWLDQAIEDAGV